ncbi:carbon-nitrogen hydrolase family protein [Embleya sp. NBC_00888]|uniref:carbon-nitrogen hydrolase family protein n=1 Tax=Embleya sp. NBC_00888 TaxID=2975960 RepID=UPI00386D16CC|nr:carbon-nitrogen hydrolase family protein [Embleya sp. NBC_00888]
MSQERRRKGITVAAVQAAPVFLDVEKTMDKVEELVAEASRRADLVVFGESFVAGYPLWGGVIPAIRQHTFYEELVASSITVPGPHVDRLSALAERFDASISIGINELAPNSTAQVFNANLVFDRRGRLVNHRRKLVATWYERLTWSHGDGYDLQPVQLDDCMVGVLICGENTNTLARYTLLAQGEQIHVASYPPAWPFEQRKGKPEYDLVDSIRLRAAAHSFEGKVFTVVAATALDAAAVEHVAQGDEDIVRNLTGTPTATLVVGPRGDIVAGPLVGEEGILYADLDPGESVSLKLAHDIVGTYNRFDVFRLTVNGTRHIPVTLVGDGPTSTQVVGGPSGRSPFAEPSGSMTGGFPAPAPLECP